LRGYSLRYGAMVNVQALEHFLPSLSLAVIFAVCSPAVSTGSDFTHNNLSVERSARDVSEEQTEDIARGVKTYVERATSHRESLERSF